MTKVLRFLAALLVAVPVFAQAQRIYSQPELDQMLAPVALYPDPLLSQVLMAATYPIEVVEAARWSRANLGLRGDDAVRAVQNEDWDPSVKSLVAFPQILQRMDENLEWTRSLGDAFLAQEQQMMDQVQLLRQRAEASGNLLSDEQIRVVREGPVIVVRPARPEYVYVPYYDPLVVYGTWWWPDYRPVYWAPWPGYARPRPSYAFWWGRPTSISLNFFFGDFDWGRRHVRVAHNSYYYRQPVFVSRNFAADHGRWQHDPHHRHAVAYRSNEVRQRFANAQVERRGAVREERRDQRQPERRADRQAAPAAAAPQAQPATQPRADRREESRAERREDRRAERQATPAQPAVQPAAQPRTEPRDERRAERQAQQQARQQAQESQQQAQRQAQESQRQSRQERRANMPAAQAPQQPRAEREEQRQERRERRENQREQRQERGQKG